MKTAVAVTLIVCGVTLIAMPPVSDAWWAWMVTRLLEHGANSVNLEGRMNDWYRFGCWLTGVAMIAVGVLASLPLAWPFKGLPTLTTDAARA